MPARYWPFSPATRTIWNSSRLFAEIDRKRRRSSSGWRRLSASARTRSLKASQDSSRLLKRVAERESKGWISTAWTLLFTLVSSCVRTRRLIEQRSYRAEAGLSCRRGKARGEPAWEETDDAFVAPVAPCQIELERRCRGSRAAAEPARPRGGAAGRPTSPGDRRGYRSGSVL